MFPHWLSRWWETSQVSLDKAAMECCQVGLLCGEETMYAGPQANSIKLNIEAITISHMTTVANICMWVYISSTTQSINEQINYMHTAGTCSNIIATHNLATAQSWLEAAIIIYNYSYTHM